MSCLKAIIFSSVLLVILPRTVLSQSKLNATLLTDEVFGRKMNLEVTPRNLVHCTDKIPLASAARCQYQAWAYAKESLKLQFKLNLFVVEAKTQKRIKIMENGSLEGGWSGRPEKVIVSGESTVDEKFCCVDWWVGDCIAGLTNRYCDSSRQRKWILYLEGLKPKNHLGNNKCPNYKYKGNNCPGRGSLPTVPAETTTVKGSTGNPPPKTVTMYSDVVYFKANDVMYKIMLDRN